MILLAEAADATKKGGQALVGGLDVRVRRNHFGRQINSFEADLHLPFLAEAPRRGWHPRSRGALSRHLHRAPVVDRLLPPPPRRRICAGGAAVGATRRGPGARPGPAASSRWHRGWDGEGGRRGRHRGRPARKRLGHQLPPRADRRHAHPRLVAAAGSRGLCLTRYVGWIEVDGVVQYKCIFTHTRARAYTF